MRHVWIKGDAFVRTVEQMVETHRRLGFDEPIPTPTREQLSRAAGIVLSANEPYFGRFRYRDLLSKVGYVFYELVKQHLFMNGNKRIATYTMLHLIEIHGYMLETDRVNLAEFAEQVAKSLPADRDKVLRRINALLKRDTLTIEEYRYKGRDDPWAGQISTRYPINPRY